MTKIPVTVRIPALQRNFEFLIPDSLAVADVQKLIARILNSEYGIADGAADMLLIDEADGKCLRTECSLSQLGVSEGAKLLLI